MTEVDPDIGWLSDASTVAWLSVYLVTLVIDGYLVSWMIRAKRIVWFGVTWVILTTAYLVWFAVSFLRFIGGA